MASIYGKGAKGRATKLHSEIIRSIGSCERCYRTEGLQAAHIKSRSYSATRTLLNNAWCLCAKCHWHLTKNPEEHVAYIHMSWADEVFDIIKSWAEEGIRLDWPAMARGFNQNSWEEEYERLKQLKDTPLREARAIEWREITTE